MAPAMVRTEGGGTTPLSRIGSERRPTAARIRPERRLTATTAAWIGAEGRLAATAAARIIAERAGIAAAAHVVTEGLWTPAVTGRRITERTWIATTRSVAERLRLSIAGARLFARTATIGPVAHVLLEQ